MGSLQGAKLGAVIDRFYEAAAQPELWRPVLHEMGLACGAEGVVLIAHPHPSLGILCSEGLDELIETFIRGGWENTRALRSIHRDPWELYSEANTFAPDELDRLPFYTDLLGPLGFRWFTGTTLAKSDGTSVIISIERRINAEAFSGQELSAIKATLPHLRRASELALRLTAARSEGMLDAFDLLNCGGMLLNSFGRVIRLNTKAQRHIGNGISLAQGQPVTSHREANNSLQHLIASALRPGPAHEAPATGAVAIPRPKGRPLIIHAMPVVGSAGDIFQGAKAILMLVDPDEHSEPAEPILRQAFKLTPAEARLAIALARGDDLNAFASAHQVSAGTARTQLKSVLAKTGTHRQAELVALLGRISERKLG